MLYSRHFIINKINNNYNIYLITITINTHRNTQVYISYIIRI